MGELPKRMTMYVDQNCNMYRAKMPALLKHLGIEELEVFSEWYDL